MAVKSKVKLLEPASRSLSNRIILAADLHGLCTVNKGLAPKVNQDLFEFRHCRTIAKKKRNMILQFAGNSAGRRPFTRAAS